MAAPGLKILQEPYLQDARGILCAVQAWRSTSTMVCSDISKHSRTQRLCHPSTNPRMPLPSHAPAPGRSKQDLRARWDKARKHKKISSSRISITLPPTNVVVFPPCRDTRVVAAPEPRTESSPCARGALLQREEHGKVGLSRADYTGKTRSTFPLLLHRSVLK